MKRNLFEVMIRVIFNIFILSAIKLSVKNNRSYNEKTKRWMINNSKLNLLLLKQIIDEKYQEICRNWTLSNSENDIQEINVIQYKILRIQNLISIIKYWF